MFPLMLLIGLGIGVLVGLTGIGGGSLLTPALLLVGLSPTAAVGTGLVAVTGIKATASFEHGRRGSINRRWLLLLAVGSIPGALASVWLLGHYAAPDQAAVLMKHALGWVLLATGAVSGIQHLPFLRRPRQAAPSAALEQVPGMLIVSMGFGVGALMGLTSVGSGSLLMVLMMTLTGLSPRELVGTDVTHGLLLTLATALAYTGLGHVQWALAAALVVGGIPGALIGSRLAYRIPVVPLKLSLATALVLTGLRLL